jgi:hypothetical protein
MREGEGTGSDAMDRRRHRPALSGAKRKTRGVSAAGFPLFCYDNVATNLGPHFFFFLATFFLAAFFLAIAITPFRWVSGLKDMLYLLIVS